MHIIFMLPLRLSDYRAVGLAIGSHHFDCLSYVYVCKKKGGCSKEIINAFSLYDYEMNERLPRGHEIYVGTPFLAHHCYTLTLFDPCTRFEKIFKGYNSFSLWLTWPCPSTRIPALLVMKFTILVTLSWSSLLYTLCSVVELIQDF